jgi:hypothetical protein
MVSRREPAAPGRLSNIAGSSAGDGGGVRDGLRFTFVGVQRKPRLLQPDQRCGDRGDSTGRARTLYVGHAADRVRGDRVRCATWTSPIPETCRRRARVSGCTEISCKADACRSRHRGSKDRGRFRHHTARKRSAIYVRCWIGGCVGIPLAASRYVLNPYAAVCNTYSYA